MYLLQNKHLHGNSQWHLIFLNFLHQYVASPKLYLYVASTTFLHKRIFLYPLQKLFGPQCNSFQCRICQCIFNSLIISIIIIFSFVYLYPFVSSSNFSSKLLNSCDFENKHKAFKPSC